MDIGVYYQLASQYQDCKSDSRMISDNDIFFCFHGHQAKGADFIDDAIRRGATLVIGDKNHKNHCPIEYLSVENPRKVYAHLKALFHTHFMEKIIAVTGTNGKTSCAVF